MKLPRLIFLGMLALLLSCSPEKKTHHYLEFKTLESFQKFLNWTPDSRFPLISAHRGGPMPGFPENCIETFDHATTYNPVLIEFDIAYSKDSVLVIMHDDQLDRTSTGKGPIENYTYEELQQFNLKDNDGKETRFKIPTLDSVLSWSQNKVILGVDLKKGVSYAKVIQKIKQYHAENHAMVIAYTAEQVQEIHRLAPEMMISASIQKKAELKRLNAMGIPNNRIVAFVGVSAPEKEFYNYLHQKGISTILGTMGNIDQSASAQPAKMVYYHLANNGADILSGDNLEQASAQLDKFRYNKKISSDHAYDVDRPTK